MGDSFWKVALKVEHTFKARGLQPLGFQTHGRPFGFASMVEPGGQRRQARASVEKGTSLPDKESSLKAGMKKERLTAGQDESRLEEVLAGKRLTVPSSCAAFFAGRHVTVYFIQDVSCGDAEVYDSSYDPGYWAR